MAGTATKTSVAREQADTDPARSSYSAMGSGTLTFTNVATEQRDADRPSGSTALPRTPIEMGTKTLTAVQAEASDNDPGQQHHQILRR